MAAAALVSHPEISSSRRPQTGSVALWLWIALSHDIEKLFDVKLKMANLSLPAGAPLATSKRCHLLMR